MGGGSKGTRAYSALGVDDSDYEYQQYLQEQQEYYQLSKQYKNEAREIAKLWAGKKEFHTKNGVDEDVEVTKSDIRRLTGANTDDDEYNMLKNKYAKDIEDFVNTADYMGWRNVVDGKHNEAKYFVYFKKEGRKNVYLALKKMKDGGKLKPHEFMNDRTFNYNISELKKGTPTMQVG